MIIAAFLKDANGGFDTPAFIFSLLLLVIGGVVLIRVLPRAFRTRRIRFKYYTRAGNTIDQIYERDKDPLNYWLLFAAYFVGALCMFFFVVELSFGLLKKSQ